MSDNSQKNRDVREWYLQLLVQYPDLYTQWQQKDLTLRKKAEEACDFRKKARLKGREMMDPQDVELLRLRDSTAYGNPDGPTFDYIYQKLQNKGMENLICEAIISSSGRTNKKVDRKFGF